MVEFANSGDPDQTPQNVVSDLGLHCLPVTRLGASSSMGKISPDKTLFLFNQKNPDIIFISPQ